VLAVAARAASDVPRLAAAAAATAAAERAAAQKTQIDDRSPPADLYRRHVHKAALAAALCAAAVFGSPLAVLLLAVAVALMARKATQAE
jgi:hypothetical protein